MKAHGYHELPEWPEDAPDPGVRNVEVPQQSWMDTYGANKGKGKAEKKKSFYSDEESSEDGGSACGVLG